MTCVLALSLSVVALVAAAPYGTGAIRGNCDCSCTVRNETVSERASISGFVGSCVDCFRSCDEACKERHADAVLAAVSCPQVLWANYVCLRDDRKARLVNECAGSASACDGVMSLQSFNATWSGNLNATTKPILSPTPEVCQCFKALSACLDPAGPKKLCGQPKTQMDPSCEEMCPGIAPADLRGFCSIYYNDAAHAVLSTTLLLLLVASI